MATHAPDVTEKKHELKQDQKAHEAQAKADKLQRKSLDNGKIKKAEKSQDKADKEGEKALSNSDTSDTDV
jgi:hypothetical protein